MTWIQWCLVAHTASTLFMVGLIWFVQIVHYPLFHQVGSDHFSDYETAHQRLTTNVVLPAMFMELGTAALLAFAPNSLDSWLRWVGFGMVVAIWASTFLIQVPLHGRLSAGYDAAAVATLVRTNWIRTVLWSARGVIALAMIRVFYRG